MIKTLDYTIRNIRLYYPYWQYTDLFILQYWVVVVGNQGLVAIFGVVRQLLPLVIADCSVAFWRFELYYKASVVNV